MDSRDNATLFFCLGWGLSGTSDDCSSRIWLMPDVFDSEKFTDGAFHFSTTHEHKRPAYLLVAAGVRSY